jgi:hypothetical protein
MNTIVLCDNEDKRNLGYSSRGYLDETLDTDLGLKIYVTKGKTNSCARPHYKILTISISMGGGINLIAVYYYENEYDIISTILDTQKDNIIKAHEIFEEILGKLRYRNHIELYCSILQTGIKRGEKEFKEKLHNLINL